MSVKNDDGGSVNYSNSIPIITLLGAAIWLLVVAANIYVLVWGLRNSVIFIDSNTCVRAATMEDQC